MLYYDKIDISEVIDINKRSPSKKCGICHYCYFLDKGLKIQLYVCDGCYDVLIMSVSLNNIAILNIRGLSLSY